tara:strand:+ start:1998 stop:2576 length:579 start_codon:yes stop_codon:yes gene_type:complete
MTNIIHNPRAYHQAIKVNMTANARKTWLKTTARANDIENWLFDNAHKSNFAESLLSSLNGYGKLTPNQSAAVIKCIDKDAARRAQWAKESAQQAASAQPIVEGRQSITGTVLSIKYVSTQYGEQGKMLVLTDKGYKLYGSIAASLDDWACDTNTQLKGQKVSFTAKVSPSDDDKAFGFYSRPTKAAVLNQSN